MKNTTMPCLGAIVRWSRTTTITLLLAIPGTTPLVAAEEDEEESLAEQYQRWLNTPDVDGDGVPDEEEELAGTNPKEPDSNDDGIEDGDVFEGQSLEQPGELAIESVAVSQLGSRDQSPPLWESLRQLAQDGAFTRLKTLSDVTLGRLDGRGIKGDHQLYRVRGYLVPPVSGRFTFWISGDDEGELWLSGNENPFGRKLIARSPRWAVPFKWGDDIVQQSAEQELVAGERYYFELRWNQYVRDGHAAVAWALPERRPAVISGRYLAAYEAGEVDDANGNGLPDTWESARGLVDGHADKDSDGDGIDDLREFQLGSDPAVADSAGRAGLVRWEIWEGAQGEHIFDLTRMSSRFPQEPSRVVALDSLEIPPQWGQTYGSRIRGKLAIPENGYYTFWISGDDHCELWLGEDGSSLKRNRIARVPGYTAWRDFHKYTHQRSTALYLKEGEARYIEVLHKQGRGSDHVSVAWAHSLEADDESLVPAVIGSEHLIHWAPEKGDANDNGLADTWETQAGIPEKASGYTDSDGDGLDNWREYRMGRNPMVRDNDRPSQSLLAQTWLQRKGSRVEDLYSDAGFPGKPDESTFVSELDYARWDSNYGTRLRGYVIPPEDGEYVFYVSGDDQAELWLSSSADKFGKQRVASVNSWLGWRRWRRSSAQDSVTVELVAGRSYYIEIVHKQGAGDGHLGVAWKRPDGSRSVITAEFLRPYEPDSGDADEDDLPDAWEERVGLSTEVASLEHGAWGDPDGDLLDNFREFQLGSNPLVADVLGKRGFAYWEAWEDLPREFVEDLLYSPRYPLKPDRRAWLDSLEAPPDRGWEYGARMRALLVPPVSGPYTFWLSADNRAQLHLSRDEKKFYKKLIAEVPLWTPERDWEVFGVQQSQTVTLEAGKKYFIEAIQKEGEGADHMSVAWLIPGQSEKAIIEGQYLIAFDRDPDDADDDDLPDAWERENDLDDASAFSWNGALGDLDGDGLSNREEFLAGTSASLADTDGDGLPDADEINGLGTDPLVANDGLVHVESRVAGGGFQSARGMESLGELVGVLTQRRGSVTYAFEVGLAGPRIFRLDATLTGGQRPNLRVPVRVLVDGIVVGESPLVSWGGQASRVSGVTPYLSSGGHSLTVEFFGEESSVAAHIEQLSILRPEGTDSDGNGIVDWLDQKRARENTVLTKSGSSLVSPVCIEGYAPFPGLVRANGSEALEGVQQHWYANVPLSADGSQTPVAVTMDNGSLQRGVQMQWAATDLSAGGELTIRKGDSLRLIAGRQGPHVIDVTGAQQARFELGNRASAAYLFQSAGDYELKSAGTGGAVGTLKVKVLEADFGQPLFLYRGLARVWVTPGVPSSLWIEPDTRLELVALSGSDAESRSFRVLDRGFGRRYILARLGKAEGPIVGRGEINVHRMRADSVAEARATVVGTMSDGSQLIRTYILIDQLPPGGYVEFRIHAGGITFLDGSTLLTLRAKDFGTGGVATVDFVRPPEAHTSVCHSVRVFEADGTPVGR